jgi:hypothetical protein
MGWLPMLLIVWYKQQLTAYLEGRFGQGILTELE